MHQMLRVLTLFVLLHLLISCDFFKGNRSPDGTPVVDKQVDRVYPHGPTCKHLKTSEWGNTSLYDLTYGCIPAGWVSFFKHPGVRKEVKKISNHLKSMAKRGKKIEPAIGNTFKAMYKVPMKKVKAVILGQDPAPQPGVATGLSFSTDKGVSSSRVASIQRVLLEAKNEGFCVDLKSGDLTQWADRGVLLLNMALTIECEPGRRSCTIASNVPLWSGFTAHLMRELNTKAPSSSFILWGSKAIAFKKYVTNPKHKVITGGHPSPAGSPHGKRFFCKSYFKCSNEWLKKNSRKAVNWNLSQQCKRRNSSCNWSWRRGSRTSVCSSRCVQRACR